VGKNDVTDPAIRDLGTLFSVGAVGGLSDGQLLGRFVERREQAVFEAILLRHGPMVWGVCRRVLRDHHDAEDAFQATFLVLARRSASIAHREKLGNWLYGVAYQTAMKARAKRTKRRGREGQVPDMPEPTVMPDELRDDLAESLDRELSRLPEKYRLPIILCELEGRSHREAANQLGWPIGTVSGRLSRARAMLAGRLSRRGVTLTVGTLAVLLAQESASANVPTKLISSTAQAASLFAAGAASATGMVSAEVAALTGEVMMTMLLKKSQAIVFSAVGALGLVAGLAWAASKDPDPAKVASVPTVDDESTSFRQESVGVDELVNHTGLNIYKFVANIPKGKRFRVVWRQMNTPGGNRVLYIYPLQKKTDAPTTILVSFLRRDGKLGSVLLSDDDEAQFRLDCSGCDPSGIATIVPLPMAGREITQKTLIVHKTDQQNGLPKVKGMRLITLLASEPGKPIPSPLPADAARGELVIEFEE
jgi:RNA polymerase sigma factor (sigma-70 family)